jgi:hypothetical protein
MLTPQDKREIKEIFEDVLKKMQPERIMNVRETAKEYGYTVRAIYQKCANNQIPFHKIHGEIKFSKREIDNYYTRDGLINK